MDVIKFLEYYGYDNVVIVDDKVDVYGDPTLNELIEVDDKDEIRRALGKYGNPDKSLKLSQINNEKLSTFVKAVFADEENLFEILKSLEDLGERLVKLRVFDDSRINGISGNALWIIDRFLLEKSENHIGIIMKSYIDRIKDGHMDIIILYTRDLHDINTYDKMKEFIVRKVNADFGNKTMFINALSKDDKLEIDFIEKAIQKIAKVMVFDVYNEDNISSIERFRRNLYDSEYYTHLVDYDNISEGKSAFQAFSDILFNTHRNSFYLENTKRHDLISRVNEITDKKYLRLDEHSLFKSKAISRIIKEFHQKKHPYDIEKKFINVTDDLGIGDVFSIEDKYYIVISQECDLIIRENGKRTLASIKTVEIEILPDSINENDFVTNGMSAIVDKSFSEYKKVDSNYTKKEFGKEITDSVIDIIKKETGCEFTKNDLNKSATTKNEDIIRYDGAFRKISLKEKNVKYFESWIFDGALYCQNQDNGYSLLDVSDRVFKRAAQSRIDEMNIDIARLLKEATDDYKLSLDKYLKLKTGLNILNVSNKIIVPVKRVARLPHELVLKYIIEVSNDETRRAIDDIISI